MGNHSGMLKSGGFMGSIEEAGKVYKHCTGHNCTQLVLYQFTNSPSLLEESQQYILFLQYILLSSQIHIEKKHLRLS